MKSRITLLLISLVVLFATACTGTKKAKTASVDDTRWELIEVEGQPVTVSQDVPYFKLNANNQMEGSTGCNRLSGKYTLDAENMRLRFEDVAASLRMCPDVTNEREILEAFNLADNYTIDGNILSLNVGRRAPIARFSR